MAGTFEATATLPPDDLFMKYGHWVATIVFLSFTIALEVLAVGVHALNIFSVPIEFWLGPAGLYLANACAGQIKN